MTLYEQSMFQRLLNAVLYDFQLEVVDEYIDEIRFLSTIFSTKIALFTFSFSHCLFFNNIFYKKVVVPLNPFE